MGVKVRSVRIWLAVVVVCAVALTGCLKNPVTGRIGPSWDVPVEVPLISGKVTVNELASEYLKEYLPEEYDLEQPLVLEISKAVRLEPDELGTLSIYRSMVLRSKSRLTARIS